MKRAAMTDNEFSNEYERDNLICNAIDTQGLHSLYTINTILNTDIDKQIYGPGHNSFVKDENGNDIMIYHARQYNEIIGDPLYDHNRHAYRMKIIWDIEGNPVFDYENNF